MLANIDKTEVLENKSAALADQAKTCGIPTAPPLAPRAASSVQLPLALTAATRCPTSLQFPQVSQGHAEADVQAERQDEPHHRRWIHTRRRRTFLGTV